MPRLPRTFAVTPVRDRSELRRFLDVPWRVHRDEPRWVPPLRADVRRRLQSGPFFERAEVGYFLAWRGSETVGRISAQVLRGEALFGFFECEDDEQAATGLVEAAASFAADAGGNDLSGPASFTTLDDAGVLVDGFDVPTLSFQPPWYAGLLEAAGCRPAADLVTLRVATGIDPDGGVEPRPSPGLDAAEQALTLSADHLDVLFPDLPGVWTPTPEEVRTWVRRLRPSLDPDVVVAEEAGAAVAVPARTELFSGLRHAVNPLRALRSARSRPPGVAVLFLAAPDRDAAGLVLDRLVARAGAAGYDWVDVTGADPWPTTLPGGSRSVHRRRLFRLPVPVALHRPRPEAA